MRERWVVRWHEVCSYTDLGPTKTYPENTIPPSFCPNFPDGKTRERTCFWAVSAFVVHYVSCTLYGLPWTANENIRTNKNIRSELGFSNQARITAIAAIRCSEIITEITVIGSHRVCYASRTRNFAQRTFPLTLFFDSVGDILVVSGERTRVILLNNWSQLNSHVLFLKKKKL